MSLLYTPSVDISAPRRTYRTNTFPCARRVSRERALRGQVKTAVKELSRRRAQEARLGGAAVLQAQEGAADGGAAGHAGEPRVERLAGVVGEGGGGEAMEEAAVVEAGGESMGGRRDDGLSERVARRWALGLHDDETEEDDEEMGEEEEEEEEGEEEGGEEEGGGRRRR